MVNPEVIAQAEKDTKRRSDDAQVSIRILSGVFVEDEVVAAGFTADGAYLVTKDKEAR